MKIFAIVLTSIIAFIVIIVLFLYNIMNYNVEENEQAIILRFGKKVVGNPIVKPGNYYHVPIIDSVKKYKIEYRTIITPQNLHEYEVYWKILDPIKLFLSGKSEDDIVPLLKKRLEKSIDIEISEFISQTNNQLIDFGIEVISITLSNKAIQADG